MLDSVVSKMKIVMARVAVFFAGSIAWWCVCSLFGRTEPWRVTSCSWFFLPFGTSVGQWVQHQSHIDDNGSFRKNGNIASPSQQPRRSPLEKTPAWRSVHQSGRSETVGSPTTAFRCRLDWGRGSYTTHLRRRSKQTKQREKMFAAADAVDVAEKIQHGSSLIKQGASLIQLPRYICESFYTWMFVLYT